MLLYRGFIGQIEYDAEQDCFIGEVINAQDLLEFQGRNVVEIKRDFQHRIDEYLAMRDTLKIPAASPFIGRFNLFLSPDQQKQVLSAARVEGVNVEAWLNRQFNHFLHDYFHKENARAS